jgi:hypothetical protein
LLTFGALLLLFLVLLLLVRVLLLLLLVVVASVANGMWLEIKLILMHVLRL